MNTSMLLAAIGVERRRQDTKWGVQNHNDEHWHAILSEEAGEVAKAILEQEHTKQLKAELIQVAAVCVAWLECITRREDQVPT